MPNLLELVQTIPPDRDEDPEDVFAAAPGLIFTDDLRVQHGDPGFTIIYKSGRFGDIQLKTADPQSEDERRLFSHYLWNSGIKLAELISSDEVEDGKWTVRRHKVLELGAGVGLCGIVAVYAGAKEVSISDYNTPVILENIRQNARRTIPKPLENNYRVDGHEWGTFTSNFATQHQHTFSRILAADCYWIPEQHLNLVRSMLHFLTLGPRGRIFVVSGFHTGRAKLAGFFDIAVAEGLEVEEIYEEDVEGQRRAWQKERDTEDPTERKRWLVVARLKRRA